jgi:Viral BACON domain
MSNRRYLSRAVLAFAGTVVIAACSSDTPTSPETASLSLTAAPTITITGPIALLRYGLCYPAIPSSTRSCGSSAYLSISNTGGGTLNWTATKSATWLKLSPRYGTAPSTMKVWVDGTGWPRGTYYGWIKVWATGAMNSPQTVSVTMRRY